MKVFLGHGASAGAESMKPFVEGLRERGADAHAVQLPRSGGAERAMEPYLRQSGEGGDVVIGGHSFGGRVASLLAAGGNRRFAGLMLFSYPLHRPGFQDQLRTEHWPRISCPVLLLQGESDPFSQPLAQLKEEVRKLERHRLVTYPGAGHGLKGKALEAALDEAAACLRTLA